VSSSYRPATADRTAAGLRPRPEHEAASLSLPLIAGLAFAAILLVALPLHAAAGRPAYRIDLAIDYDLLTFKATADVDVPVAGEVMKDAVFFLYANASGIVDDDRRKYIVVDGVRLSGRPVPYSIAGAILRAAFEQPQQCPCTLRIEYHGIVPRSAGAGDTMGGLGGLGDLLGSAGNGNSPQNTDFGLYSYSDGVLSLGSFWYPQLAVRKNGTWADEAPKGLGDVTYAEAADFDVGIKVPSAVRVVTSGTANGAGRYLASNVRDFAVLMSEDYVCKSSPVSISGRSVSLESCTTRKHAARLEETLGVAGQALQVYSRRFGPYPYDSFKVVEGTIRGGAGGMEFSGLTAIAPMLFTDWNAQFRQMSGLFGGLGDLDKLLSGINAGGDTGGKPPAQAGGLEGLLGSILGQQSALGSVLEMTVAHEVAHQWWAIAVGSDSVREPFVDESLTNYSAIVYFEDRYGRTTAEKMIDMHLKTPYSMARMLGLADAPANLPTSSYSNNIQYSAVVYGKGALYYDALRRLIGDEAFFAGLRAYYAKYRGAIAGSRSLLTLLTGKLPGSGIDRLYTHWIEEQHGDQDIGAGQLGGLQDLLQQLPKGPGK
jgi:hypothetical protein